MCRGHIPQLTGQIIEDILAQVVSIGLRDGVSIKSISIDNNSFKLLKTHKNLPNNPNSFEMSTKYKRLTIHSN